ncbi:hypothetical protein EQG41_18135 [Billgrantia azerbaijanica]|nr:hypothetical protein EQG41_18135 [Halomonas azerbaijanica]
MGRGNSSPTAPLSRRGGDRVQSDVMGPGIGHRRPLRRAFLHPEGNMKPMSADDVKVILDTHHKWLDNEGGERANLRDANLRGANLCDADLCGADLWGLAGNLQHVKSLKIDGYMVTYTADMMQIDCRRHPISKWWAFDDRAILEMDGKRALDWWRRWKPLLQQIIEASPAEPTKTGGEEAVA